MPYLVAIYCIATAINVVLPMLATKALLAKLLLAFYIAASSLLAVSVGDEMKTTMSRGSVIQKLGRTVIMVIMLFVALWLSMHFHVNLYFISVRGLIWCVLGVVIGFLGNPRRMRFRRG